VQLASIPIPAIGRKGADVTALEVDRAGHMLYVADRTDGGVDVFDVSTPNARYVTSVLTSAAPNGVSAASDLKKVIAGLDNGHVAVIETDPASSRADTVIEEIDTGSAQAAGRTEYDPADKKAYVVSPAGGLVTVIDLSSRKVLLHFEHLAKSLDQPRYNPGDGMMYVTSAEDNAIFQFDPSRTPDVMVRRFDVRDACNPKGMAIDPDTNQALLGCANPAQPQHIVVWDLKSGSVLHTVTKTGGADGAMYAAAPDRFLVAAPSFFRGPHLAVFSGSPLGFVTNVPTVAGSGAVAYDELNNLVYMADTRPDQGALLSFPLPGAFAQPATPTPTSTPTPRPTLPPVRATPKPQPPTATPAPKPVATATPEPATPTPAATATAAPPPPPPASASAGASAQPSPAGTASPSPTAQSSASASAKPSASRGAGQVSPTATKAAGA